MNHEKHWLSEFQGKTIRGVRPTHEFGPVPQVNLMFTDGTAYLLSIKEGVYFEGCLINTLRRAQSVSDVVIKFYGKDISLEIRSKTFPMLELRAVAKELPAGELPFEFRQKFDA
jgi:predicted CopG family antitoxin